MNGLVWTTVNAVTPCAPPFSPCGRGSPLDLEEEMDLSAVETRGGRWWESRLTSRLAFMVSKAAGAAVWDT